MITKFLTVVVAICLVQLALLGIQSPEDPLFLFISNSGFVVLARLTIVALLLYVCFKNKFTFKISQMTTRLFGIMLATFGLMGTTSQTVTDEFGGYVKALDFLFILGVGITFVMISYSYKAGLQALDLRRMLPRISLTIKPAPAELPRLARTNTRTLSAKGS